MKQTYLLHHLDRHGARIDRAGRLCSLWVNPTTANRETIPHDSEIAPRLALGICRGLAVPDPTPSDGAAVTTLCAAS